MVREKFFSLWPRNAEGVQMAQADRKQTAREKAAVTASPCAGWSLSWYRSILFLKQKICRQCIAAPYKRQKSSSRTKQHCPRRHVFRHGHGAGTATFIYYFDKTKKILKCNAPADARIQVPYTRTACSAAPWHCIQHALPLRWANYICAACAGCQGQRMKQLEWAHSGSWGRNSCLLPAAFFWSFLLNPF